MFYNIHSHSCRQTDAFCIRNVHSNFDQEMDGQSVSLGLHPWYLNSTDFEQQFASLKKNASRPEVFAIGECGLDKITPTTWDLQLTAFQRQIILAEELSKPIIIHCVKAFNEVLSELKHVQIPVIFHGINNKLSIIQPVMDAGYYLSFGKSLLSSNASIQETFIKTPLSQVFLETDDLESDISEIYKLAAQIKNVSEKEIVLQLENNFSNVFNS
ncbi:TatD family hydrolase [Dyadobacter sp. CY312]|uniref:TatD family hydrolase n=1 Tax=Dyadobacter sp. CY312 TaxID=2907303 RepID=UPI001F25BFAC|nr:TatD family hydrolase [Dyadobacter sp. CY312]MCE7044325.1 TatD family hydrolase [Dyadobacter sp. CY312]